MIVIIAKILTALVAIEHLYILYIEMFAWETTGKRVFKSALPEEMFKQTKGLAANQGLYNGFLSVGLFWSFIISDTIWQNNIAIFFLGCVVIAGLFGGFKSSPKIFLVQALPASIALILTLFSN